MALNQNQLEMLRALSDPGYKTSDAIQTSLQGIERNIYDNRQIGLIKTYSVEEEIMDQTYMPIEIETIYAFNEPLTRKKLELTLSEPRISRHPSTKKNRDDRRANLIKYFKNQFGDFENGEDLKNRARLLHSIAIHPSVYDKKKEQPIQVPLHDTVTEIPYWPEQQITKIPTENTLKDPIPFTKIDDWA